MTQLMEIKALVMGAYKRYDRVIIRVLKFLVAFIAIIRLNGFFGFSSLLSNIGVEFVFALLAAFLPGSWFLLLLLVDVGGQLFSYSVEAAAIVTVIMLVVYFLFARLQPKYAYLIILTPLLKSVQLMYVLPLLAGIFFGPGAIIPIAVGVGVYRFASYMPGFLQLTQSSSLFEAPDTVMDMYQYLTNAILEDKQLYVTIVVFAIAIILMYIIRRLEVDYVWYLTIAIGTLIIIIGLLIGSVMTGANMSLVGPFIGGLISGGITCMIQFFRFSLDYKRTEKLQFEDDDYYYYVKTIPKVRPMKKQKEVKHL